MFKQLKKLNWFFKERLKYYILGVASLQMTNIVVIIPPLIIGSAIDKISNGTLTIDELTKYILLMVGLLIAEYVLGFLWSYNVFSNAMIIDYRLRSMIMKKVLTMSRPFFEKFTSGDLMSRATSDIDTLGEMLGYGVLAFFDGVFYLGTIILAMIFMISWKLTLVSIIPLPLLIISSNLVGTHIHNLYMKQQESFSKMYDEALENINGVRVVRSYVLENQSIDNFDKIATDVFNKSLKTEIWADLFWPTTKIFTSICYAIAIGYGSHLIMSNEISLGDLISFNLYLGKLIWPMFAIGDFINVSQRGTTSLQRIYEILDEKDNVVLENEKMFDENSTFNVTFDNYSFTYPTSQNQNLEDISFVLSKGNTLGIVGKTGSGKSTIIKQLLKEYEYGTGDILIGDSSIRNIEKSSLMSKIGYVSQDSMLFSKSIRENILMGKYDATDEEIDNSIFLAALNNDVNSFSNGLETLVGERGVAISGGQKQRISIARALIKKPELLILDDALSAVDSRTQMNIITNLRENRKNKTTIIVTHRLSLVSHADEILVIDDGKIVERGTHSELIEKDGWYKEQYFVQQMREEDGDE